MFECSELKESHRHYYKILADTERLLRIQEDYQDDYISREIKGRLDKIAYEFHVRLIEETPHFAA
jgi:hypothetical protein